MLYPTSTAGSVISSIWLSIVHKIPGCDVMTPVADAKILFCCGRVRIYGTKFSTLKYMYLPGTSKYFKIYYIAAGKPARYSFKTILIHVDVLLKFNSNSMAVPAGMPAGTLYKMIIYYRYFARYFKVPLVKFGSFI